MVSREFFTLDQLLDDMYHTYVRFLLNGKIQYPSVGDGLANRLKEEGYIDGWLPCHEGSDTLVRQKIAYLAGIKEYNQIHLGDRNKHDVIKVRIDSNDFPHVKISYNVMDHYK